MLHKILFLIFIFVLSLTASHANKTPDLVIAGVTDSLKENIEENPDLQTILESKNLVFNPIKIEKQVKSLLYLEGYFDAFLNLTYNEPNNIYNITIDAGQQYKVSSIEIDEPSSVFTPYHLIKIRKDDLFDGHKLVKAEKNILEFLTGTECRYIKRVKHIVKLNEFEKTADIIFDVGVSPSSVFGTSRFDGVENIHLDFFKPLLQYEKGACYTEQDINATIKEAINTNLFDNIYYEIDPQKKNAKGVAVVDVIYQVNERKHRTFNYGFGVSDTEAFIFSAGNQWRNLFNRGVTLDIQTRLSDRSQTLDFDGQYPSYFGFRENLNAAITLGRQRFDTYSSDGLSAFMGYERLAANTKHLSYGIGVRSNFSKITESAVLSENYFIAALPLFALYDSKDNFLRPTAGNALRLDVTPAVNLLSANDNFLKNQASFSHYLNVGSIGNPKENSPTIIAFKSTIGSIIGSNIDNIPVIERFYAGGGGSVRGYNYQDLGDLRFGQPRGGASLFETSLETRIGIGKTYGLTFFVDAGNVYPDIVPDIGSNLQFAAGIGGRFYSDVLPIRLDIGVPINPRADRNDNFGFYFGIGESF